MKKRTRTILFSLCTTFFLLAAPSVILYSQGYRFDFDNKKVVQTGAFYFKVFPKSAEIYLDVKLKKKTSALAGSVLIENLLPKKYEIEIKKEGFCPWQKNLETKEKQVTEAKNIILFPEELNFTIISREEKEISTIVSDVVISATSSDGKKVVDSNNYEIWVLFLEDSYDQLQKKAGDKIFLTRFSEKIGKVFWLTSHYLIFNVGNKIKIAEIDNRDRINIANLAEFEEPEIFWDENNKQLYILSNESLYGSGDLLP